MSHPTHLFIGYAVALIALFALVQSDLEGQLE